MKPLLRLPNAEQRKAGIGAYIRKRPHGDVSSPKINKKNILNMLSRNLPVINAKGTLRRVARRRRLQGKPLEQLINMTEHFGITNTRKGLPYSNLNREQLVREFRKYNQKTATNTLSNQNLVNYLASRHFKRHVVQNLNTRNNSIRIQKAGTCWFHAILNGWLLSPIGRKILLSRVKYTTQPNAELDNVCPLRKKIPNFFWNYIRFELHAPRDHIWANMKLQNKYHEANLIKSIGLRNQTLENVSGGNIDDVFHFMNFIAPNNWSHRQTSIHDIRVIHFTWLDKPFIPDGFEISHAYIGLFNSNRKLIPHAITGYVTSSGEYKIADSNSVRPFSCDWFTNTESLYKYARRRKLSSATEPGFYVDRLVIYIKKNPSERLFLPWQKLLA
jgi:hypothetical protein